MEDDMIFYEDLDIFEATREAIKAIAKTRKYPSIKRVRKFLYENGRKNTKGLTDSWWLHYTDAWKSILGAVARGV